MVKGCHIIFGNDPKRNGVTCIQTHSTHEQVGLYTDLVDLSIVDKQNGAGWHGRPNVLVVN